MARRPKPLHPDDGPAARFALELRALRDKNGAEAPSVGDIHKRTNISKAAMFAALSGDRIPSRRTLEAMVQAWGGNTDEWLAKRRDYETEVELDNRRNSPPVPRETSAAVRLTPQYDTVFWTSPQMAAGVVRDDLRSLYQEAGLNLTDVAKKTGYRRAELWEIMQGIRLPDDNRQLSMLLTLFGLSGKDRSAFRERLRMVFFLRSQEKAAPSEERVNKDH